MKQAVRIAILRSVRAGVPPCRGLTTVISQGAASAGQGRWWAGAQKPASNGPVDANVTSADSFVTKMSAAKEDGDVATFVVTLKNLAHNSHLLEAHINYLVIGLVELMTDKIIRGDQLASCIWSLGKLGFHVRHVRHRTLILQLMQKCCAADGLAGQDMAKALDGLLKTGLKMSDLADEQRKVLIAAIFQTADSLDGRNLANVLKVLGKWNEEWSNISPAHQDAVWRNISRTAHQLSAMDAAMTLHSFGQLSLAADTLTEAQLSLILEVAVKGFHTGSRHQMYNLICQDNSMTLVGLGMIGIPYAALPAAFVNHMQFCLIHSLRGMDGLGVSNVIHSLGFMGTPFKDLSPSFVSAVATAFIRLSNPTLNFVQQNVANILSGFAGMGAKWDQLPKIELESVIARLAPELTEDSVAVCIDSLAKMEATWTDLPLDTVRALAKALNAAAPNLESRQLSTCMYGVALMCFDVQLVNVKAADETEKEKKRLLDNIVTTLTKCYDPSIAATCGRKERSQFSIYFAWLSTLPDGKEMMTKHLGKKTVRPPSKVDTALQLALSDALPKALQQEQPDGVFRVDHQFDGFRGVFGITTAIYQGDQLIALVEVDRRAAANEKHWKHSNKQSLVHRRNLLRDYLCPQPYRNVPICHASNHNLATKGADAMAAELAQFILKKHAPESDGAGTGSKKWFV